MNPGILKKFAQAKIESGYQVYRTRGLDIPELRVYGWNEYDSDLNDSKETKSNWSTRYSMRVGDRVTIIRNSVCPIHGSILHTETVANGDTGELIAYHVSLDDKALNFVEVRLDDSGVVVDIPAENFDDITLGYASTVHKAQGSGYKCVMVVYDDRMQYCAGFNSRNMLYTAITRTKEFCALYGLEYVFQRGLDMILPERNSLLAARILGQI